MNDKAMVALIMAQVLPRMTAGVALARNFQPRLQGAATGPIVYFTKITDRRYGWNRRSDVVDAPALDLTFTHTEAQLYETTYQFTALVPQDPAATTELTESDVLNAVSAIIQSDGLMAAFRTAGVGVQRVTDVRNPYFVDDRERFEASPSFDVVLTHYRSVTATIPGVVTYETNFNRI